ncbi:unnamed protein product [Soboliphyme baturini]|uniref:Uncharacterized protein n=1 Tax=Soboliphyme baturini TaxID=241478 RepID=A0A183IBD4_9BILA|nr:unnamed protein product [Soboliphyme baturini]
MFLEEIGRSLSAGRVHMQQSNNTQRLSPAPSFLSLRFVETPNEIRLRYRDASKFLIWPEHPLREEGIEAGAAFVYDKRSLPPLHSALSRFRSSFNLGKTSSMSSMSHKGFIGLRVNTFRFGPRQELE